MRDKERRVKHSQSATQAMSDAVVAQKSPGPLGSPIFGPLRRYYSVIRLRRTALVAPCTALKSGTPNGQCYSNTTPTKIHPLAIIHPKAKLASDVEIGPASSIGEGVSIDSGTTIAANVFITGETKIGKNNKIFSGAVIGTEPQDLKFRGEKTFLEIGDNNTIREYVTIHRGSASGRGKTTIGNNCFLMVSSHIAHDCQIGNAVGMTNLTSLGGHVTIGDGAWIGGMVGIHHFVTVGKLAFIGGYSKVVKDVPPFMLADGRPTKIRGLNIVGLKRAKFSDAQISILKRAYQLLYRSKLNISQALERIEREIEKTPEIAELIRAIKETPNGRMGRSRE